VVASAELVSEEPAISCVESAKKGVHAVLKVGQTGFHVVNTKFHVVNTRGDIVRAERRVSELGFQGVDSIRYVPQHTY